jgi:NADPH-dependent 2,4-dienoyl-CoA reductase/sulfur reductase-like enzyme
MLPGQAAVAGVHVVRTLDDALRLKADLRPGRRLVVVGDGVLGTEVAATGRTLGCDVTVTGPQALPMLRQLGPLVAAALADLHREHGVEFRLGVATEGLTTAGGRVIGVALAGGDVLPADVVVVALGALPDVGWLAGSGLVLDDGVVCDPAGRAAPGVYAVGDVARFHHAGLGRSLRLENRTNATEQANLVAAGILGEERAYLPVPYLWTDQYDSKLQVHGLTGGAATATVVLGTVADRRFVVTYHDDGAFVGVLGWGMPKPTTALRRELAPTFTTPGLQPA